MCNHAALNQPIQLHASHEADTTLTSDSNLYSLLEIPFKLSVGLRKPIIKIPGAGAEAEPCVSYSFGAFSSTASQTFAEWSSKLLRYPISNYWYSLPKRRASHEGPQNFAL